MKCRHCELFTHSYLSHPVYLCKVDGELSELLKYESIESLIAERDYYKRLAEAAGEYIDYHNDVNNTYEFDPVKFDKLFENYQSIKQERER